jgi:hypothetical protein
MMTRQGRAGGLELNLADAQMFGESLETLVRDMTRRGLSPNAAFIAARRPSTRGADLEGRSFLHEYDWTQDQDGSILSPILSAPMVVASWINLQ